VNVAPENLPIRIEKPWGYEVWYAWTDQYAGKLIHVNAGCRLSLQYHNNKDESCFLLSGSMLLTKGSAADDLTVTPISEGHAWRNTPGEIHTIEAVVDSDVLEVSTPHLDDVVRLQDLYGREGTCVP
jgi:mannose-6-phosphate isomerase